MADFVITDWTKNRGEHEVVNRLFATLNIQSKGYVIRNCINKNGKNQGSCCSVYDLNEVLTKLEYYIEYARIKKSMNIRVAKLLLERIENDRRPDKS